MRKFLKSKKVSLLLVVLLASALAFTGCGNGGGGGGVTPDFWHGSFDVIVIGAGISGYTTYLSIMQAAYDAEIDLDVLFIEQRPVAGGITTLAGGPDFNAMANWHGLEESDIETRYNLWMLGSGGENPGAPYHQNRLNLSSAIQANYPDYALLHPIFRAIRDAEIFLFNQFGGNHTDFTTRPPGGLAARVTDFTNVGGTGVQFMQAFGMAGDNLVGSGHLRVNTRATALHMAFCEDADEYIGHGITLVDHLNRTRNYRANVIVFATGSFSQNEEMKAEFGQAADGMPATGLEHFFIHSLDWVGADGSGINILRNSQLERPAGMHRSGFGVITGARPHRSLLEIGREALDGWDEDGYSGRLLHPAFGGGTHVDSILQDELGSVLVNAQGNRTLNEWSLSAWNAKGSQHMLRENLFPYWRVFRYDGISANGLLALEQAIEFGQGSSPEALRVRQEVVAGEGLTALANAMFPGTANAAVRTTFLATMAAYDAWVYADTGTDPHAADFYPVGEGKTLAQAGGVRFDELGEEGVYFFAVRWYPTGWDTAGGVRTNYNAQVLDTTGDPIHNVFAVGGVSNRFYFGETYVGGSSLTFYPAIARRAAAKIMYVLGHDEEMDWSFE